MASDEERRKFIRLDWRLPAKYAVVDSKETLPSLTRNVGGGGVSLFTRARMAPGTVLNVEVNFPGRDQPIQFVAEVAWSGALLLESRGDTVPHAFETGLRFTEINEDDRQFILKRSQTDQPEPPA